jgi:hypothetical protein
MERARSTNLTLVSKSLQAYYRTTVLKHSYQDHLGRHEEYVRSVTPPERLFFFNVKEGWEPLCKILNVPVPDVPFPHVNDAEAVQEIMTGFIKKALGRWLVIITTLGVAFGSVWWAIR